MPLQAALEAYESEMLCRSEAKVLASLDAALYLHSVAALAESDCTRAKAAMDAMHGRVPHPHQTGSRSLLTSPDANYTT